MIRRIDNFHHRNRAPGNSRILSSSIVCCLFFGLCPAMAQDGEYARDQDIAWWDRAKIRFFWCPWMNFHDFAVTNGVGDVDPLSDEELIEAAAAVGATVFADRFDWSLDPYYGDTMKTRLKRARLVRSHGMRYFATLHSAYMDKDTKKAATRLAVNKLGKTWKQDPRTAAAGRYIACPIDEAAVDAWPFRYALDMAKSGVVDGLINDWEISIAGFNIEAGDDICYCDHCFSGYAIEKNLGTAIAPGDRHRRLKESGLLIDYLTRLRERVLKLYRRGGERVRAVKPDFIFAAYGGFMPGHTEAGWFAEGVARGLNTPEAPFFVIDASHYYPHHTAPWWDTGQSSLSKLGMKHILGFFTSGLMGTPTTDVSAVQQLYDAAINTDGYWVWVERKWGPEDYRVFRSAHERIRAVENRVGDFLTKGEPDRHFATVVEQSGDPKRSEKIVSRVFHLDERHVIQINNVNSDHAVSLLIRCPRLDPDRDWTASNAMSGIQYTTDGKRNWTASDLDRGIVIEMEKRSDVWVLIAPLGSPPQQSAALTVSADVIKGHPQRSSTGPLPTPGDPAPGEFPLAFVRRGPLGYAGAHEPVMGPTVFLVDAAGDGQARQIFGGKGNCWSATLSPDRRRVAFSHYANGQGQIYLVNGNATVKTGPPGKERLNEPYFDTSGLHFRFDGLVSFAFESEGVNISDNEHCEHSPVWSPDGGRIAFVSDAGGDWNIWVMNGDGGQRRRVTDTPGIDRNPAWSPDGKRIAFESNRGGDFSIHVVGDDGSYEKVLEDRSGDDLEPVWSPDGRTIAFVGHHQSGRRDIRLVDVETGVPIYPRGLLAAIVGWQPYRYVGDISWSPDGEWIAAAYVSRDDSGIFVARTRLDGSDFAYDRDRKEDDLIELVKIPPLKTRPGGRVMSPVRHLVTGGWYDSGDASIRWIMRSFKDPVWSPDGKTIAFRSDMDPSGYEFLYTVPAGGGKPVRLDDTLSPMGLANRPTPLNPTEKTEPEGSQQLPQGMTLLARTPEFWFFRKDPERVGEAQEWFSPSPKKNPPEWIAQSTHAAWKEGYIGHGWYALDLIVPETGGKRIWMHLGGVDENYTLWVNGQYVSDNMDAGPSAWDKAVSIEITDAIIPGDENHFVIRARNTAHAGGVWKPISILTQP
jgi:Tol biopolymer transport system component